MATTPSGESDKAKKSLKEVSDIVGVIDEGFRELTSRLTDVVDEIKEGANELTSFNNVTKDVNRSLRSMSKVNEDLIKNQVKLNQGKLSSKQIDEQINKAVANRQILTGRLESLQRKMNEEASVSIEQHREIENLQRSIAEISEEVEGNFRKQKEEAQKLEKTLGLTGKALKGISKIPILGDLVDTDEALQAATTAAQNGAGKIGALGAAMGSLGKSLVSSLMDPVAIIGLLVKGFMKLIELGFAADKQIVDLSKSMGSSREQAAKLRQHFVEIQDGSVKVGGSLSDNLKTTKNLVAAQLELADAFGTGLGFTDRQVADQVLLTKQIGMSADEAASLQQLAMANGKTADDVVDVTIKQTASLAKQTGIQLNNKKVLSEVAKVSGQLRLQYQNNPELIAKAVIQTQKLGVSLEQAAKSANHLLNFEESIEDQISAELLTGKQLNLERARLLALNGDVAGSMQEMLSQVGSAAEFSQMNVLQQEALAKAVGMTADELANSLIQQENLNKLGSETKKNIEERVKLLRAQGETEKANKLMASIGNEEDAKAALIKMDAQTNFNNLVEKLQGILGSMAEGPMAEMLDQLATWMSNADNIKGLMEGIKTVAAGIGNIISFIIKHWKTLAKAAVVLAAYTAFSAASVIPVVGPALGAVAALKVYSEGMSAINSIGDGEINSDGLIVGKYNKGQIQPIAQGASNDNVIFTTNKPNPSNNNNNASMNINVLLEEQKRTNALLERQNNISNVIANKNTNVQYDSQKAGTAADVNSYRIGSQFITN
jgi:hypothetical protein